MNRRWRWVSYRLMSGAGALVAGIAFFAVLSQAGNASTICSDCYIVTPATAPATAGAGTGEDYAFQVTNNDPNETLKTLTFTAPANFVITSGSPNTTTTNAYYCNSKPALFVVTNATADNWFEGEAAIAGDRHAERRGTPLDLVGLPPAVYARHSPDR